MLPRSKLVVLGLFVLMNLTLQSGVWDYSYCGKTINQVVHINNLVIIRHTIEQYRVNVLIHTLSHAPFKETTRISGFKRSSERSALLFLFRFWYCFCTPSNTEYNRWRVLRNFDISYFPTGFCSLVLIFWLILEAVVLKAISRGIVVSSADSVVILNISSVY